LCVLTHMCVRLLGQYVENSVCVTNSVCDSVCD
jgi:hypothetical protein